MKILFLAPKVRDGVASFAETDVTLLRDLGHDVRGLAWRGRPWFKLAKEALWADLIYCWFVGHHSYLASFLGKPLVVCIGGYDFANMPEYRYGNMTTWFGTRVAHRVWNKASALLYVSTSLMVEAESAFGHAGRGTCVPLGFNSDFWTPGNGDRRWDVMSVMAASDPYRARLKGLDVLYQLAWAMPDVNFHVAGLDIPFHTGPANLMVVPWLSPDRLRAAYRNSKVYLQLSHHEGLPSCLAEAMLCGCVPVATDVGDAFLLAGGLGQMIPDMGGLAWRVEAARRAVQAGLQLAAQGAGTAARERIRKLFTLETRKDTLRRILEAVVNK